VATSELYVGLELEGRLTELLSYVVLCTVVAQFSEQLTMSLDSVLSHWAYFTVLRFILVYVSFVFIIVCYMLYYFNMVRWTWLD